VNNVYVFQYENFLPKFNNDKHIINFGKETLKLLTKITTLYKLTVNKFESVKCKLSIMIALYDTLKKCYVWLESLN